MGIWTPPNYDQLGIYLILSQTEGKALSSGKKEMTWACVRMSTALLWLLCCYFCSFLLAGALTRKLLIVWMVCYLSLYLCLHYHLWQEAEPKYKPLLGQTHLPHLSCPCPNFLSDSLPYFCEPSFTVEWSSQRESLCWTYRSKLFGAILVYGLRLNLNLNSSRANLHLIEV